MNWLVIGNIIMFIGSILMCLVGLLKKRKTIIGVQSVQILLMTLGNAMLVSIPGTISNTLGFIRNILCYYEKLNILAKIVISILSIVSVLFFNNIGWFGMLPIISTVAYIWLMNTKDANKLKLLIIATTLLWTIHDVYIKAYTVVPFDIITIITNLYSFVMLKAAQYGYGSYIRKDIKCTKEKNK